MARTTEKHGLAAARLAVGLLVGGGAIAGMLVAGASWGVAVTGGWALLALVFLAWVWIMIWPKDAAETKAHARAEDVSRPTADLILIGASVASLVAVGYTLVEAGKASGGTKVLLIALALAAVALAWAAVHTVFILRYADLYYGDPQGGIDFNEDDPPDYRDITYLAFTIGMTFQVSDTALQTKQIRAQALKHALLSYLFGAVIVAVTINVVASLLKG